VVLVFLLVACLGSGARADDAFRAARDHARSNDASTRLRGVRELIGIDSAQSVAELERVIKESRDDLDKGEREIEQVLAAQLRMLPKLRDLIRRAEAGASITKDADRVLARCEELEGHVKRLQRDLRVNLTILKTAAEGFVKFRDPEAIGLIEKGAESEFNTMVRIFYIAGMRHPSRKTCVATLLKALDDKDPRIRAALARALVPLAREPGVQQAMEPLAADEHWAVRLGAYQVIAGAPFIQAVERLCRAAGDEKGEIAFAVDSYLEALTGVSYRQDPTQWRVWWKENEEAIRKGGWSAPPPKEGEVGETKTVASFFRIPLTSRRILFAIDFSDSMSIPIEIKDPQIVQLLEKYNLAPTRLGYAKAEFIRALAGLPDGAFFGVVGYNDDVKSYRNGQMVELNKSTRKAAVRWITGLETADLTNIFSAINAVFRDYMGSSGERQFEDLPDTVLLLTDGNATRGRFTEARDILDMTSIWNGPLGVVFHCVGIGADHDRVLLKELSGSTGGFYVDVSKGLKALQPRKRRLPEGLVLDSPPRGSAAPAGEPEPETVKQPDAPAAQMPPALRKLVTQFQEGDTDELISAAKQLGELGATAAPAAAALVDGLSDYRDNVRAAARDALAKIGSAAVPALIRGIEGGDPDVIVGAADALASMGSAARAAEKTLEKRVNDEDDDVRAAVRRALEAIRK